MTIRARTIIDYIKSHRADGSTIFCGSDWTDDEVAYLRTELKGYSIIVSNNNVIHVKLNTESLTIKYVVCLSIITVVSILLDQGNMIEVNRQLSIGGYPRFIEASVYAFIAHLSFIGIVSGIISSFCLLLIDGDRNKQTRFWVITVVTVIVAAYLVYMSNYSFERTQQAIKNFGSSTF